VLRALANRLLLVGTAFAVTACFKKDYPSGSLVVSDVELQGTDRVASREVLDGLATAESPKFLGIWDGVIFDYEVYDETLLERDLGRIERYYRARGYYEARVTAARIIRLDGHHVGVQIRVSEGQPVRLVGAVQAPGLERLPPEVSFAAIRVNRMAPGEIFDEAVYEKTKRDIVKALADRGYAYAKVKARANVDIANHSASVVMEVDPGRHARYGKVRIVGLEQVPEGPVRDNLEIVEGEEYSRADLDDARAALINLGVFASVDVKQDLSAPESGIVPITVAVKEAPLRTLRLGGGMRLDVLELSSHLTIGWEHRNFLGGMRKFSIETRPGVVFYPTRIDNLEAPTHFLPRNFVRAELRQPAFLEGRTTGFVAGEFNIYPVLYPSAEGVDPNANVLGYEEVRSEAGAERAFFSHHLYLTPSYNFQVNAPFAYIGDNKLDTAYISYPQLIAIFDFRDDPIDTHSGVFFSNSLQVAGFIFGGDASDVRVQPEVRTYVPISKSVTFATRMSVGFIFPDNYGETIEQGVVNFSPAVANDPAVLRDEQLLLLRAFFSGGPTSNRGYPYRGVGPQGILAFLLPNAGAACIDINDPRCLRALGGLTLWEASVEVRLPILGPLRSVVFVDASDVSRERADLRFNYPHLSPGLGLRYSTPVGPIRFDVGYRVPYLQQVGQQELPPTEGAQSTIFGAPIAMHFALGEAF
jgi:outer membrane protein insertion porin family/translocation and assembly module TamA